MKQSERRALRQKEILQSARLAFGRDGYANVRLGQICEDNKISKGALYHYFRGKDDLFLACVKEMFQDMSEYLRSASNMYSQGTSLQRLTGYFMCCEIFFRHDENIRKIYKESVLQPPKHLKEQIWELQQPLRLHNQKFLKQIISSFLLRDDVSEEDACRYCSCIGRLLWDILEQYQPNALLLEQEHFEKLMRKILQMILWGIAKE